MTVSSATAGAGVDPVLRAAYVLAVRESIQRVLRDGTLVTVAFAIALGYSLYSVAQGANFLLTTFLREFPDQPGIGDIGQAFSIGSLVLLSRTVP